MLLVYSGSLQGATLEIAQLLPTAEASAVTPAPITCLAWHCHGAVLGVFLSGNDWVLSLEKSWCSLTQFGRAVHSL